MTTATKEVLKIHDVKAETNDLPRITGKESISLLLGNLPTAPELIDCSGSLESLVRYHEWDALMLPPANSFMGAIHLAFSKHYPLVLSPDAVWLTIAQGIVKYRLVKPDGEQKNCSPVIEHVFGPETRWEDVVGATAKLLVQMEGDLAKTYLCDFSTSGPREVAASGICLMDAYKAKYKYTPRCVCGIPYVELKGTVEDWKSVKAKAETLIKDDEWKAKLMPILDQFINSADGRHDEAFWKDIYKIENSYAVELANGWATHFFPFLGKNKWHTQITTDDETFVKNPMIYGFSEEYPKPHKMGKVEQTIDGVYAGDFPISLSTATIQMPSAETAKTVPVEVVGGLVGIKQHDESKALEAVAGWAVRKAS